MALIVGRLVAQLGLDDSGFTAGMGRAKTDIEKTSQAADKLADSSKSAAKAVEQIGDGAAKSQGRARTETERTTKATNDLAESAKRAEKATEQAATGATTAQNRARTATDQTTQSTNRLSDSARRAQASVTQVGQGASGVRSVKGAAEQATTATNGLAEAAGRAKAALATVGIGVGIGATIKAMTDSIGAARALGAQTNQMNVIFGDGKAQIEAWGSTAVDTMRMSQREAQGAAVQFATFGKAMGLTGDDLVNFSEKQAKLAADLASFQGIPVADAIQAMGSAYAGETETMRQYGVLLDENTIKQAAYANGVASVGTELTVQQKAVGVYYSMMEQLNHVNGDVERSNGKFGASMKTLTARLEETQAAVGQKLIPVVQPFIDMLSGPGLSAIQATAEAVGAAGHAFSALPGPIQQALAAVVLYRVGTTLAMKVAGDQIVGLKDRATGAFSNMRQSMNNVQRAASLTGNSMSNVSAGIIAAGRNIPIIDRMRSSFINAAAGAERFPRAAGTWSAATTGMSGSLRGLMGVMGGPWGLAIAGATTALSIWIAKKNEDAQKSQEAKAATQQWADAFTESKGAIDASIQSMAAKQLSDEGVIDMAKELGVSTQDLTEAFISGKGPLDAWIASQSQLSRVGKDDDTQGKIVNFTTKIAGLSKEYDDGRDKARQMAAANGDLSFSFNGSKSSAGAMSKAMQDYAESTDGAATRVEKLAKALNSLRDDKLTQEEALQGWSDGMRSLSQGFSDTGKAAIDAQGHFDVTTEAGSKLQDLVVTQGKAWDQVAAAEKRYADQQVAEGKMSRTEAVDYMNGKLSDMREQFINAAVAAGYTREEAQKLSEVYLGVPGEVATNFQMTGVPAVLQALNDMQVKGAQPIEGKYHMVDNTPAITKKLDEMGVKYSVIDGRLVIDDGDVPRVKEHLGDLVKNIEEIPPGFVEISDTSAENILRLQALGVEVQRLPDGTIVINPDDAEFWKHVQEAQKPGAKQIYVSYVDPQGRTVSNVGAGGTPLSPEYYNSLTPKQADGSITEYAGGGVRPAGVQSMPDQAVIEKGRGSGLVRWAEGETWWESYIPGAPSKRRRSTAILDETARRFGYALMPVDAMRGILGILQRGDYTPAARRGLGVEEDSPLVDFLMKTRAGQADSPWTSARKDASAILTGGADLLRGQYNGVLSRRFNIEEDSPWIARFFGPRGPSMMRSFADGGVTGGTVQLGNISGEGITSPEQQSMWDAVRSKFGDAVLSSATRTVQTEGHADYHNAGRAIDISGPSMASIASWIAENYPDSMELIHSPFGHNIKDGKDVGDGIAFYGADTMAGHQDHVHWALGHDATAGANGAGVQQIQDVTLTSSSSRDDVARKIIAEGRKRGYTDDQIKAVLATAIQESNLDPNANGGGGAWHGIFQQDESYEGRDDPNTNISGFYDRLDEKRAADPDADIYDQIFWLQQRPGESSAANAVANGRGGYMDEIKSKDGDAAKMLADLGPSVGNGTTDSTSGIGNGTQVYVTGGRLDSIGSGYTPSTSTSSTSSDSTASSPSTTTTSSPERKRLFTLGGNRWPFYNGSPEQPKAEKSSPDTTSKTKKGPAAPSESSIAAAQAAVEKAKRSQGEAVEKQRIAEMRLDEVRANPKAKPSQIAAAEESVARAKNAVVDATDKQRIAEMRLQELQNKKSAANAAATPPVKRLHGGTIPGTGRGDIIPMMGEPGEEVIRRPVAEMPGMRGALKHLNRTGRWPEFHADGGTVGGFTSGFGGYTDPAVAKVGILDHAPGYYLEQLYRLGVAGYGGAAMAASAIGADGSFQGLSTGSASFPILDDIAQKLDEVIKEGRVGSIGIYVGEGGQIVVEDMGKLRQTQDKAVQDAMMRSAVMR